MTIQEATDKSAWNAFLATQKYSPFLQSWTMGEVYNAIGQPSIRLEVRDKDTIQAVCQAIVVPARRGRHLSVPYGPVIENNRDWSQITAQLIDALKQKAIDHNCTFIRLSPFWEKDTYTIKGSIPSPLHMLAEHIWYLSLENTSQEDVLKHMRKNTRNLIRRAEKEGVTIERSSDPVADLPQFIALHEETRKRHSFTPYTNAFFQVQVEKFAPQNQCTMYKALYQGGVIACSIHMHAHGETSYHHGASTHKYHKIPASYLLQWTAIQDAIQRGDTLYSFWGIAPLCEMKNGKWIMDNKPHPFKGVTTFKMGFGGQLLNLQHCVDIPVNKKYWITRGIETLRKWKRGF